MERLNNAATRAINALPAEEAEAFDSLASEDPYLSGHLDQFRHVADRLVEGLPAVSPAPSPVIWERIAHEVGFDRDEATTPEGTGQPNVVPMRTRRRNLFISVASVAAALVIGVAAGSILFDSAPDLRETAVAAATESGSTSIKMESPVTSDVTASVVLTADGTGYLIADSLPALPADRTYQLWVIVDDQVVSAGLLGNDPDVVQFRTEGNVVGMAISEEVAGGVVVSQNDPVALWLDSA
jgi:hypothetical protein